MNVAQIVVRRVCSVFRSSRACRRRVASDNRPRQLVSELYLFPGILFLDEMQRIAFRLMLSWCVCVCLFVCLCRVCGPQENGLR